jgi:hypothetical protein
VAPIVFCDDEELLPRAEAERELGLQAGMTTVLVQLGQGPEVASAQDRCLRALAGRAGVQVCATSSAVGGLADVPEGIVHLRATYPMSRYYEAFDGAVSAAGYNAFHELIRFRVPSVFVPMQRETDDQAARARYADRSGVGAGADGPADPGLERRLEALLDSDRRRAMRDRLGELRPANGAADAARWLEEVIGHASAGSGDAARAAADRGPRPSPPGLGARLHRATTWAASVPRTLARLGSQTVSGPRLRTLVVALGVEGTALERGVGAALERTPDPPERVLVATDSLAIGSLRRTGVAVEHLPAANERQAELAGGDYGSFLRRRLGLILAQRPRFRRALAVGEVPGDLLAAATSRPRRRASLLR